MAYRVLVIALVASAVALPLTVNAEELPGCSATWYGSRILHHNLQNDADSGLDAGNVPADALELRPESYSWGLVEPVDHVGGDAVDWYHFTFNGTGQVVMLDVRITLGRQERYVDLGPEHPEELRLQLEVWPPGATEPLTGEENVYGGTNVTFVNDVAGRHDIKVYYKTPSARAGCGDGLVEPPVPNPVNPVSLDNYGVYFGCRPVCRAAI